MSSKTKQVRWQCPNGHAAVLGPQRPRRDNTCRYCLTCSAKTGKLVERAAPTLEAKRSARAETLKASAARKAATKAERLKARHSVGDRDLREVLKKALTLPAFKSAKGVTLVVRRRVQATLSGYAYCWFGEGGNLISLTVSDHPMKQNAELEATGLLLHELAHIACWREGKPYNDKDTAFAHKCEDGIDQWNEKYGDQIDHRQSGAYQGKIGRRNSAAGRRQYAADVAKAEAAAPTPAAERNARIAKRAKELRSTNSAALVKLAAPGLSLRVPPALWGEFEHFIIETTSDTSEPVRQRLVAWLEKSAKKVGPSRVVVLPEDEEIREEFVSEMDYAVGFHSEPNLVSAHALMWAKALEPA